MAQNALRFVLLMIDETNLYQQLLKSDGEAAAKREGVELEVQFCGYDGVAQIHKLYAYLKSEPNQRPQAVIILPQRASVLARAAQDMAREACGLAVLNRIPEELEAIRKEYPKIPMVGVSPDQKEIGRIQGHQFMALLPKGGTLLYIRGDPTASLTKERQFGMEEVLKGASIKVNVLEGSWVADQARKSLISWFKTMSSKSSLVDLVGCQNDDMALGACEALKMCAADLDRPEIKTIPVTGCDGVPWGGQKYVSQGILVATVINPPTSGAAVEALAKFYRRGVMPPAKTILAPKSVPELVTLSAQARRLGAK